MELLGKKIPNSFVQCVMWVMVIVLPALGLFKYKHVPELEDITTSNIYAKKWEKYGAYYDKDEIILTSIFLTQKCVSRVEVFKKIKILTTEGAKYGTVPIYRYAPRISHFEVLLFTAKGNEVPLNQNELRKKYNESGKIIIPQVTAGSEIIIRIEFLLDNTYYISFAHWFNYPIPVSAGRFIHNKSSSCVYDYRACGNRLLLNRTIYKKGKIEAWKINNLEPKKDLDFQDYDGITEPTIIARLVKVKSWNKKFHTEKKIFKQYKTEYKGATLHLDKTGLKKNLNECIENVTDPLNRARKILKWVQDNMTPSGEKKNYYSNIFEKGEASDLQIACICDKMFSSAGLESYMVITSNKDTHILDKSFLLHSDYLTVGLPLVTINNINYVAYPYAKGYELGEYPLSFNGSLCMNLKEKVVQLLSSPLWGKEHLRERRVLDLSSFPGTYSLVYEYKHTSASSFRNYFLNCDKQEQEEYFEDMIKKYKPSNTLQSFSIKNLHEYEKPLVATVTFTNDDMPIEYGGKTVFKLNNFFRDYFKDITADRTEDVIINNRYILTDELEVMKIPGKKLSFDIKTEEVSNGLFAVVYKKSENDTSYLFQRILIGKVAKIYESQIKQLYNDCVKLNSIKNSSINISNK